MDEPTSASVGRRIIDLAERAVYISVKNRLLVLDPKDGQRVTVELAEVAAVLAAHHGVTFTRGALAELAGAGAIVVVCDQKSMPAAMLMPLHGFHAPARRMAAQAAASRPMRKRIWKSIVCAKLRGQAAHLRRRGLKYEDILSLVVECKSGDPANVEAQASRLYWQRLFGPRFRRLYEGSREVNDENRYLNYGYAVLRAIVCRAICGAGLHPGLGIHHHHRNNPFPLADDLMEPFRPLVDDLAAKARDAVGPDAPMDAAMKERLLALLRARVLTNRETLGVVDAVARIAGQLGEVFEKRATDIDLPRLWVDSRAEKPAAPTQIIAPADPSVEFLQKTR